MEQDRVTEEKSTPVASNDVVLDCVHIYDESNLGFGQWLIDCFSNVPGAVVVKGPAYQTQPQASPYPTNEDMKYIDED